MDSQKLAIDSLRYHRLRNIDSCLPSENFKDGWAGGWNREAILSAKTVAWLKQP